MTAASKLENQSTGIESEMRRVLMVSPHFPPDTTAGTHRVRLLVPHLKSYGWTPTVLTVDPRDYEGRLDPDLAALVPDDLEVIRCRAWSAKTTRKFKLGDLGVRAFRGLWQESKRLLSERRFDAFFVTIYPAYPALLGPLAKRKFGIPFVLDYQDPWVGSWGLTVGGGAGGSVDLKSRWSRRIAALLEPKAVRAADAITAVSAATYEQIRERNPGLSCRIFAEIPLGGESRDFEALRRSPRVNRFFDPNDGDFHLCYVGTLLPTGFETLRAVLKGVRRLKETDPASYARLRLHFFGTSNQTAPNAPQRVLPEAAAIGVADRVQEIAPRIDYLDALTVQLQASAILLMGSSERHYTASKLYPALLAERPLLAAYHADSTVTAILRQAVQPPVARVVAYDDVDRAESKVEELSNHLRAMIVSAVYDSKAVGVSVLEEYSARSLAGKLARVFNAVSAATSSFAKGQRRAAKQ
jgi:glycosyltransferase involved in cell wall biosynthesis